MSITTVRTTTTNQQATIDNPGATDRARPSPWRFVAPWALGLLIVLVYMPALDAGYVNWDDDRLILYTTRYRAFNLDSLRWMFTTSYGGHFQPLTWLSYALDWALWRRELFGFHLTNVLLHVLAAITFYMIVCRLLALGSDDHNAARSGPVVLSAALAAVLFAVHPLRVESVAWLAERRDVLSAWFYLLSILCYLRYARRGAGASTGRSPPDGSALSPLTLRVKGRRSRLGARSRRTAYVGSVVLAGVSLLAKATAITLPFVLLILDVYPLRRWRRSVASRRNRHAPHEAPTGPPSAGYRPGHVLLEKVPFLLLALAGAIRALTAQQEGGALYSLEQHDLASRFAQSCIGLVFYLWKTVYPSDLGPLYEIPSREVLFGPWLWISLGVLMVTLLVVVRLRHRLTALAAAFAVYVVIVSPVLGLAQSGPQLVADRYSYLPCTGFAALAGAGLLQLLRQVSWVRRPNGRALLGLALACLITGMASATYRQADHWLSGRTLWRRGVEVSPDSAIAHTNYADALVLSEMPAEAADEYRRALQLNPEDAVALHHFGDLFRMAGNRDAAIYCYVRSLRIDPSRRRACFSLARLLAEKGRTDDAVRVLRDGVRRHPGARDLKEFLGLLLAGRPTDPEPTALPVAGETSRTIAAPAPLVPRGASLSPHAPPSKPDGP